ncbi:NmrA family NAD(P)-binding protein [Pseudarthrobacter sp. TAF60_1]|uniref:NmrA family NAD(P)-binding protein n=1 Tax=Pseudarthrobacter sp. TAF60_1 TaxID=3233071 RepID=UPI003F9638DA
MNRRPSTVLVIGATGSIGRHAVAEALRRGCAVRALVRDRARAKEPETFRQDLAAISADRVQG